MEVLNSGRRGQISIENIDGKKILTKIALDETKKAAINKEAQIITKLNNKGINFVPQIIDSGDGFFKYEYIEGIHYSDYIKNTQNEQSFYISYSNLVNCAYRLDKAGVFHWELHNPYTNVLIDKDLNIFIIDFDRGKFTTNEPKNLKGVAQWLTSIKVLTIKDLHMIGKLESIEKVYNFINNKLFPNQITFGILGGISSLFLLDQFSKIFIYDKGLFEGFYFFTPVLNKGITRGIGVNFTFLLLFSFACIFAFYFFYKKSFINNAEYVLLMGGLMGNFVDRLFIGGVRDFIDFKFWPIFNFADIYLFIAMMIILYSIFKNDGKSLSS
ncbi:MAG: signal peptidase II [Candidatus Absconditabacteria bacterium]